LVAGWVVGLALGGLGLKESRGRKKERGDKKERKGGEEEGGGGKNITRAIDPLRARGRGVSARLGRKGGEKGGVNGR